MESLETIGDNLKEVKLIFLQRFPTVRKSIWQDHAKGAELTGCET